MDIAIGTKTYSYKPLKSAARANNFPDLLFIASGKVGKPGAKAKFRITLKDGGGTLKKWSQTVEYTEVDGGVYGNMFDGFHYKKDDIQDGLEVKFEVNTGSGWQEIGATDAVSGELGPVGAQVIIFDTGADVSGTIGFTLMF